MILLLPTNASLPTSLDRNAKSPPHGNAGCSTEEVLNSFQSALVPSPGQEGGESSVRAEQKQMHLLCFNVSCKKGSVSVSCPHHRSLCLRHLEFRG